VALSSDGGEIEAVNGARLHFTCAEEELQTELSKLTINCEVAYRATEPNGSGSHITGIRLLPPGAHSMLLVGPPCLAA
jgi:hypothetical protein